MKGMSLSLLVVLLLCACATPLRTVPDTVATQEDPNRVLDVDHLPENEPFDIEEGGIYYTKVNFWYEFSQHATTNYMRGQLVPVNSRVTLRMTVEPRREMSRKPRILGLRVRLLDSKTSISITNARQYSKASMYEIIYRTFSPEPVDLDVFDEETQASIKAGQLREGMTRYETPLTTGYPPAHRTPSLQSDQWVYWSSRFRYDAIHFSDG